MRRIGLLTTPLAKISPCQESGLLVLTCWLMGRTRGGSGKEAQEAHDMRLPTRRNAHNRCLDTFQAAGADLLADG